MTSAQATLLPKRPTFLGIYPKLERGNQEFSYFTNAFLNDEDAK